MSAGAVLGRYILIAIIWMALVGLAITMGVTGALGSENLMALMFFSLVGGVIATLGLVNGTGEPVRIDQHAANVRKRKNAENVTDMDVFSLLRPEDIEELRENLKDRLNQQIADTNIDDFTTFEALLSNRKR